MSTPFGGHFGSFFRSFSRRFFSAFSGTLLFVTLGDLGAQRWPKGLFGEGILEPFGEHGQHVKIDVLCRRQLNSEGSGGSRNRRCSRRFSEGVKSAPLGGILADFCDFGGPIGFQKGSILTLKRHLFWGLDFG